MASKNKTKAYTVKARSNLSPEKKREAMYDFARQFEGIMSKSPNDQTNGYPVSTIYPSRENIADLPVLIIGGKTYPNWRADSDVKKEAGIRRIYHIGDTTLSVSCVPNTTVSSLSDELSFRYTAQRNGQLKRAAKGLKKLVDSLKNQDDLEVRLE